MNTKNIFLKAAVLAFTITLAACGNKTESKDGETATADAGVDISSFKEAKIDNRYSMKLPDYMSSTTTLNDDASLQYQNIIKETYMIVIDEDKQEFVDALNSIGSYDSTASILKNYSKFQAETIKESASEKSNESSKGLKINGFDAEIVEFEGKIPEVPSSVYYMLTFIESADRLYMVMAWTFVDRKDKYKPDFEAAVKSFTELKKS